MKKRLLLLLLALLGVPILLFGIYLIVIFVDAFVDELEADAAPVTFASYNVHESSTIDPATILSSINQGDQNVFNFELGFPPDDSPFVTSVEWRQEDFMNLAASIFHVAWNEFISDWNLYRMRYWTRCDDLSGFSWGSYIFIWKLQIIRNILCVALICSPNMDMLRGVEIPIVTVRISDGR